MNHFYHSLRGWFDAEVLYAYAVATAPARARMVEVGAYLGKSTAFLGVEIARSRKDLQLLVIDTWRGSPEHQNAKAVRDRTLYQQFLVNIAPIRPLVTPVIFKSVDAARHVADGLLHFVFIDADHSEAAISADITAWLPKIAPGGILAGHDIYMPSIARAVDRLLAPLPSLTRKEDLSPSCWCFEVNHA